MLTPWPCAGVSKCGTTDLYKKLLVLPHVQESRNKGPHFWDEAHAFSWYLDLYADVAAATQTDPLVVSADASSNTFTYAGVGIRWVAPAGSLPARSWLVLPVSAGWSRQAAVRACCRRAHGDLACVQARLPFRSLPGRVLGVLGVPWPATPRTLPRTCQALRSEACKHQRDCLSCP